MRRRQRHWLPLAGIAITAAAAPSCGDNGNRDNGRDASTADAAAADAATADAGLPDAGLPDAASSPDADALAPTVVSTTPVAGDGDVPIDVTIVVRFSEVVDPATVTPASLLLDRGGAAIAGAIVVDGAEARFTPAAPLAIDADHTITITTAVADPAGNHLASDHAVGFRTQHRRRVFVTSVSGTGNLSTWPDANGATGLAAGDAICQARAAAAGIPGSFVAWLSDASDDAFCRVQGLTGTRAADCGQATPPAAAGPWMRVDGVPWAGALEDLVAAPPRVYAPVALDELGAVAPEPVFSNTGPDGSAVTTGCGNWSDGVGGVGYGGARMTGTYWTQWGAWSCGSPARLLCFEVGDGPALEFPAITDKRAFITSTTVTGNLAASPDAGGATGVAAGDAICRARATAAGLADPLAFKAWLSDAAASAASRFTSDGPWVRLDGLRVADSEADLLDARLATTLNLTETGAYLTDALAWTGTAYNGTANAWRCGDWTGTDTWALAGRGNDARKWTVGEYITPCATAAHHLYCLED
jgi:hypothetical protein